MKPDKLPPTLGDAFWLLFARQVKRELSDAHSGVRDAKRAADHYASWLASTGKDHVWGDDARASKRALAKEKKNLAFWQKAARELKLVEHRRRSQVVK